MDGNVYGNVNPIGVDNTVGSMGSISMDNPTVRMLLQRGESPETIKEALSVIETAVRNGIPPEKMQIAGNIDLSALERLYEAAANQQGKTLDDVRKNYEAQSAADMAALQAAFGAAVGVGGITALGDALTPNDKAAAAACGACLLKSGVEVAPNKITLTEALERGAPAVGTARPKSTEMGLIT